MTTAALARYYDGCFVPTSHPQLRALEAAAADGLCVLTWYARGVVRVAAPWPWPTRALNDLARLTPESGAGYGPDMDEDGPIVWP